MKIYIIPAWYPQNEDDVTASFFREQAHALADRGHDITVIHIEPISVTRLFRQPKHDIRLWQDGNVRTVFHKVIVPLPAKLEEMQDGYISKLFCRIIKKQIDDDVKAGVGAPDLLHAHVSHSCAYYCLRAKEVLNIPLVVTEHYSGLVLGTATEREYARVRETIEKADAFIFVGNNFQKEICERLNATKTTVVIPNMIDTSAFQITNEHHEPFTFLAACHLKAHKSVDLVVKAFHRAFDDPEPVKLLVAGDGPEYNAIQALIAELGESGRVHMLGKYAREDSGDLFSKADAFVLTSKVEPFGIVYIEALAGGVPCIGTKGQGADDIINETNGFLVKYGDMDELADRMKDLYQNRASYDSLQIRNDCISRFDNSSVCKQLEALYSQTVQPAAK